jgi:hypothetical protein
MKLIATLLCSFGVLAGPATIAVQQGPPAQIVQKTELVQYVPTTTKEDSRHDARETRLLAEGRKTWMRQQLLQEIDFKHGDISWLPALAAEAGWPKNTWDKLGHIILRESGGCPNRRGGDAVDKDCNVTKVVDWSHRSDSGLLQINGVYYDPTRNKWALLCREMNVCTQEPLLDPITNLEAGKLLYDASGWGPWDPCTWDKTRCPKPKKAGN